MTDLAHIAPLKDPKPWAAPRIVTEPPPQRQNRRRRTRAKRIRETVLLDQMACIRQIIRGVAEQHKLTVEEMLAPTHHHHLAHARHHAMYLLRNRTPQISLPRIARAFGKHHTTILCGVRAHCRRNGLTVPRSSFGGASV